MSTFSPGTITESQAGYFNSSVQTGIVASTTHTLAGASTALLSAQVNRITTCNGSDAVALPSATQAMVGAVLTVINDGAGTASVWPQSPDRIDGRLAGQTVSVSAGRRTNFFCTEQNVWCSQGSGVSS